MSSRTELLARSALLLALSLTATTTTHGQCDGGTVPAPEPGFVVLTEDPAAGFLLTEYDLDFEDGAPVRIGSSPWDPLLQFLVRTETVDDRAGFLHVVDPRNHDLGGFDLETGELQTWELDLEAGHVIITLDLDPATGEILALVTDGESSWLTSGGTGGLSRVGVADADGFPRHDATGLDAANRRLLALLDRNDGVPHLVGLDLDDGSVLSDVAVVGHGLSELRCLAFDDARSRLLAVVRQGRTQHFLVELDPETGETSAPLVDLGSDGHVAHSSCEVEPGGGRLVTTKGNDLVVVDLETNLVESRFSLAEPPFYNVGAFGFTGRQAGGCSVGVEDLIEQLRETTDALLGPLHRRIGRSLDAKIQAASASWVRCQPDTACHQLDAFRNEVAAMERSDRLDSVDAAALDLGAALVQGALSECPCLGGPGDRR